MIEEDKLKKNNSSDENSDDASGGENLQQDVKTTIKKIGAFAEFETIEEGAPNNKKGDAKSNKNNSPNNSTATIDESQLGPSMGIAKDENSFTDPETQDGKKTGGSKLKARLQNFIAGLGQDKINLRGEFKGEVNINDVKNSSEKESFESRLKQSEKQQHEALEKTIENNANKNGVVRRILAKLEEKIERNPELAERFDTKAEVIKHVGHVPASQMSHVDKLVARAQEIQGKSPFDF